jgi:branched-chain amino acid transport system permease protein
MKQIFNVGRGIPSSLPVRRVDTFTLRRGWFQWGWCLTGLAALLVAPAVLPTFWLHIFNLTLIAVVGAVGLNLLTGNARLVSLGQAAFLGAGGFTAGLMTVKHTPPFLLVLLLAILVGCILGFIVAIPSLRLRVLYVAVTTLALHFAVSLALNMIQAYGLDSSGMVLPIPTIGSFELNSPLRWYYFLLVVSAGSVVVALNLLRSFVGRRWVAVADHDLAAESLGIPVTRSKISVFVISSGMGSLTGALLGYYLGTVTFEYYNLGLAITYLAMIIVGGIGRVLGSVFGAFFITVMPYVLDRMLHVLNIGAEGSALSALHEVFYGALIVGFLLFEPRGLAEIWRRIKTAALDWPFRYRSVQRAVR